jgi:hypothetical protein
MQYPAVELPHLARRAICLLFDRGAASKDASSMSQPHPLIDNLIENLTGTLP